MATLPPHTDGSVVFARWRQCTPIYRKTKMIATAMSFSCRVSAICAFYRPTTQTPSITNCLVAVIHTKPVIAIGRHGNDP